MTWVVGIGIGLFLLFRFPKPMMILLGVVSLGAAALFAVIVFLDKQSVWKQQEEERSILLVASFDSERCGMETPILIRFTNIGTKTLLSMDFQLSGYRKGFSSPIYGYSLDGVIGYKSDKILSTGESYQSCWKVPKLHDGAQEVPPLSVEWRATYIRGYFEE
jgi:hypothetical protein